MQTRSIRNASRSSAVAPPPGFEQSYGLPKVPSRTRAGHMLIEVRLSRIIQQESFTATEQGSGFCD